MVKQVITTILIFVVLSVPVFAQAPPDNKSKLTDLLGDVKGVIFKYKDIVDLDFQAVAKGYLGDKWLSPDKTSAAYSGTAAPGDYYPDAPQEIRDWGYTLENLRVINFDAMAPLDFATWLGGLVSLPFVYIRGLWALGDIFGVLGLFIRWLMLASMWVLFVYTVEFIAKVARSIYDIGMALVKIAGVLKFFV